MFKAIIFDCFGVLTTDVWDKFLNDLPPNIDKEKLQTINNEIYKNNEMIDFIRNLRNQNYKIGMISNISSNWINDWILERGKNIKYQIK